MHLHTDRPTRLYEGVFSVIGILQQLSCNPLPLLRSTLNSRSSPHIGRVCLQDFDLINLPGAWPVGYIDDVSLPALEVGVDDSPAPPFKGKTKRANRDVLSRGNNQRTPSALRSGATG